MSLSALLGDPTAPSPGMAAHGTRSISKLLEGEGVDASGWDLGIARGVSYDGTTIVGQGVNPDGVRQPWVAHLEPATFIPEPPSIVPARSPPSSSTC